VTFTAFLIGQACMSNPHHGSATKWGEFDSYDGFSALRASLVHPGHLDEPVELKLEEASVMWMAFAVKMCLEKNNALTSGLINNVLGAANQRPTSSVVQALYSTSGGATISRSAVA
jgi:hypothetical protein